MLTKLREWRQNANRALRVTHAVRDDAAKKDGRRSTKGLALFVALFVLFFLIVIAYLVTVALTGEGPGSVVVAFSVLIIVIQQPGVLAWEKNEVMYLIEYLILHSMVGLSMLVVGIYGVVGGLMVEEKHYDGPCVSSCGFAHLYLSELWGGLLIFGALFPIAAILINVVYLKRVLRTPEAKEDGGGTQPSVDDGRLITVTTVARKPLTTQGSVALIVCSTPPSQATASLPSVTTAELQSEMTQPSTIGSTSCSCENDSCSMCEPLAVVVAKNAILGCACSRPTTECTCTSSAPPTMDDSSPLTSTSSDIDNYYTADYVINNGQDPFVGNVSDIGKENQKSIGTMQQQPDSEKEQTAKLSQAVVTSSIQK